MKVLINENQLRVLLEHHYNEINTIYDWYEIKDENLREIFYSIKNKIKIKFIKINPTQYQTALTEFVRYGQLMRFPEDRVQQWKNIVLTNIAMLGNLTEIHGHSNSFPYDEFYDVFQIPEDDQNYSFGDAYEILDNIYNIDDYVPFFSNGQPVLSDFGLKPLYDLGLELLNKNKPEDIIIVINKILDIVHPRSDLAELFIYGGSKSLNDISGYEKTHQY